MTRFSRNGTLRVDRKVTPAELLNLISERKAEQVSTKYGVGEVQAGPGHGDRAMDMLKKLQTDRAHQAAQEVSTTFLSMQDQCESEIEKLFLLGLMRQEMEGSALTFIPKKLWVDRTDGFLNDSVLDTGKIGITDFIESKNARHCRDPIGILQQFPIAGYRVDFLLFGTTTEANSRGKKLRYAFVVECDGHDHHERTKEQAARDRKRDRAMLMFGLDVMRFTGSELWKDADQCAAEALKNVHQHQAKHFQE